MIIGQYDKMSVAHNTLANILLSYNEQQNTIIIYMQLKKYL